MKPTLIATVAAVLVLAGCSTADDTDQAEQPTAESEPTQMADDEMPMPPNDGDWEREYHSPEDIIAKLNAAGVQCETEDPARSTAYSLRGQFCYVNEARDEGYSVDVYGSGAQQGEAHVHYQQDTSWAGTTFVWGTGWSVSVPFESDGSEVVEILGGEVEVAG